MTNPYWIVTADTQLGAIHWNNPEREDDYYRIFQDLCTRAVQEKGCLGMLGLGDMRERASIQAKNLGGMNRGLQILLNGGKPLLTLMGNHDYTTPNWIEEMCYPSMHNLTDPKVQEKFGFDPDSTLALDFKTRGELEAALLQRDPRKISLLILHQSLRELTTSLKQSHDTSAERLAQLGFGRYKKCVAMIGDLHNYGDCKVNYAYDDGTIGHFEAVYPGSPEMTDINEGVNGLKSERIQSNPHDYRKFALRYYPADNHWEPFELDPRPWFRGKSKTPAETDRILGLLAEHVKEWKRPGCLTLTVPKKDLERVRDFLKPLNTLEARVEEFSKETEEEEKLWETPESETSLSWQENKASLLHLAEESELPAESLQLLREIIGHDGSSPNPKNDVAAAWRAWAGADAGPDPVDDTTEPELEPESEDA